MSRVGVKRPATIWFRGLALVAVFLLPVEIQAQEPDTIPRDSVVVPIPPELIQDDTVPDLGETSDSILPAPSLPEYPDPVPSGWAWGRWYWSQEELSRYHGLSLLDLLERVPGLGVTRSGGFGRPTGLSALGAGGARLRVFVDGYELDPLAAASFDLQNIGIVDLGSLRVDRGMHETRIEISTFELPDMRPFSRVEVGAGNYESKLLRALFSRPIGTSNVVTAAFGLASTRGIGIAEPFTRKSGSIYWMHSLSESAGLQAQYRYSGVERQSNLNGLADLFDENLSRQEFVLRGRAKIFDGLTMEAIAGRSWRTPADSTSFVDEELASTQALLRATFERKSVWVNGRLRSRFGDSRGIPAPDLELFAGAGIRPMSWLTMAGMARTASAGDLNGTELSATVTAGRWGGVSLFGSASTGSRALGLIQDSTYTLRREFVTQIDGVEQVDTVDADTTVYSYPAVSSDGGGFRAGAEWARGEAVAGIAFLSLVEAEIGPFGTPFDAGVPPISAEASTGFETYVSLPLLISGLRLEGSYTRWSGHETRPYLPAEHGRLALAFHELYYDGQFEPTFRVEGIRRGAALVPDAERATFGAMSEPYNLLNVYLELQIQDVQAYIGWDNVLNDLEARDLPAFALRLPRMMYGVSWRFRN